MATSQKYIYSIILSVSILLLPGCGEEKKATAPKAPPPLNVETVTVEKKKFPLWMQYTGMTKAISSQEIRARASGRLEKRYFEDGATVNKGDKLFFDRTVPVPKQSECSKIQKRER